MALTAGSLSQVSVAATSDSVLSGAATMGSSPYTYQWYRSISGGTFTPGSSNIISGATALALADTNLVPSTTYYYKVVVTDTLGSTATSAALTVTTSVQGVALPITDVVNVSVATVQQGANAYNTGNLALITRDAYNASTFGSLGYKIYQSPTQVGTDFGTSSNTYLMAVSVFSQQPNILAPGGSLIVIPYLTTAQTAVQQITFVGGTNSAVSGHYVLNYNSNPTAQIQWNASATDIQNALQAVSGLGSVTVSGTAAAGFTVTFTGVSGAASLLTVTSNTLVDANNVTVVPTPVTTVIGSTAETLDRAINRTQGLVQYFGIMTAEIVPQAVMLLAAAEVQALNCLLFVTSYTTADVATGGMLDLLRSGGYTHTRAVPYFENNTALQPTTSLQYMAAYAGLGLSTIFTGSNTTQTMDLKSLSGINPDPSMSPTLYALCQAAGADVYANIQGVSKVLCSNANDWYDNQYNLLWFAGALQIAGFNYLATVSTKIPQTEAGMTGLKTALRAICQQAVTNQMLAPGSWTSPTTFGVQSDLYNNIAQFGYYIYSAPISQQLQTARVARQAPLCQIGVKFAGAIQSSSIVVYVNA